MVSITENRPDLSVVVPVYNNAQTLHELRRRIHETLTEAGIGYEIVFVNDHGPDNSLAVLEELADCHPGIAIVNMKHNVGQHAAVFHGLRFVRGDCCVIMDADLQDPPEALPLLRKARASGIHAIFAGRRGRYQRADRMLTSKLYKTLLHHLAGIPKDAGIFVLLEKTMVDALLAMRIGTPWINVMIGLTGMPVISVPVERSARDSGHSAYSSMKRLASAWRGIRCVLEYRWQGNRPSYLDSLAEDPVQAFVSHAGRTGNGTSVGH